MLLQVKACEDYVVKGLQEQAMGLNKQPAAGVTSGPWLVSAVVSAAGILSDSPASNTPTYSFIA